MGVITALVGSTALVTLWLGPVVCKKRSAEREAAIETIKNRIRLYWYQAGRLDEKESQLDRLIILAGSPEALLERVIEKYGFEDFEDTINSTTMDEDEWSIPAGDTAAGKLQGSS